MTSAPLRRAAPVVVLVLLAVLSGAGAATAVARAPAAHDGLVWSADGSLVAGSVHRGNALAFRGWNARDGSVRWELPISGAKDVEGAPIPEPASIQLSADGNEVLLVSGRGLWFWRAGSPAARHLKLEGETELGDAPRLSPSGGKVAFVRGEDVAALDVESGTATRLTDDGTDAGARNAAADERLRGEHPLLELPALLWAPSSRALLFLREEPAPAGSTSFPLRLGVADLAWQAVRLLDLGAPETGTPVRATWRSDSRAVAVERLSPDRTRLDLLLCQTERGRCVALCAHPRAADDPLVDSFRFFGSSFVWSRVEGGVRGLFEYDGFGREIGRLLPDAWSLTGVAGFDLERGTVAVRAVATRGPGRGDAVVISVPLRSGVPRVLARGDDEAVFAPAGGAWVHGWHDAHGRFHRQLVSPSGEVLRELSPTSGSEPGG